MGNYRKIWLAANGPLPQPCTECGKDVEEFGRHGHQGQIHHHNHDHYDDRPENLRLVHKSCHQSHHMKGVPKSTAHKVKLAIGKHGKWSDDRKASFREQLKPFTPEQAAKHSAAQRTRRDRVGYTRNELGRFN